MVLKVLKFTYRLFPKSIKNSKFFHNLKIIYWRYFENFRRYIFLKKTKFNISKDLEKKFQNIRSQVSNKGITVENDKSIFSNDEVNTLQKILDISKKKAQDFEINKNNNANFVEQLKKRGVYKPFRFDIGNYLTFKEKKIDTNEFQEIHYQLLKIGLKEEFLYLASIYLGIYPFLGRFYAWYDFPTSEQPVSSQCWHKDGDDRKFIKIFIYLNDVNSENGPFCYIQNTHKINNKMFSSEQKKKTKYSSFNILEDKDVSNIYPKKDVKECFGEFGTTIFADTSGFHKGKTLKKNSRVMLVYEYFSEVSNYTYDIDINESLKKKFNDYQLMALRKF